MDEQRKRIQAFCESGAIGVYDADDLHSDVRWLYRRLEAIEGALGKSYGTLEGSGATGLMWRAAEVLEYHAGAGYRSVLAENLRAAAIDICRAVGSVCSDCGLPRPLLALDGMDICRDCLFVRHRP